MHWRRLGSMVLVSAAAAAILGCGELQDPINRVEAYALPKSLFTGEWWYLQTVVEVPGTKTVTMVGNTNYSGMHRIRWDVQENWLYARKSVETVAGAKGVSEDTGEYMGAIVGAWRIQSHFDIKRGYNPNTGEENNVLEENTYDCKWYDCKYMRIDWSQNQATDYMFLDSDEEIIKAASPFYNQDNDPRWKPVFDADAGYIDVTTSMAVTPGKEYFPEYDESYPICWMFDSQHADCNTEIIKIRNSFLKRDPNRDYQPRTHEASTDEWFGFFIQDRFEWENHYTLTNKTKQKIINRHNLWEQHHYTDKACKIDSDCASYGTGVTCDTLVPFHKTDVSLDSDVDGLPDSYESYAKLDGNNKDTDGDGTKDGDDDSDNNGKRDLEDFWAWDKAGLHYRCAIPMDKREPVPVAYFDTGNFPRELKCDKDDKGTGPCKAWTWTSDAKTRRSNWSAVHHISEDYGDTFWWIFLRGGYGFTQDEFDAWKSTHNVNDAKLAAKKTILSKFGDATNGYYGFTICPNNPVQEKDPWPCRFPHHSFRQAKELMDAGLKYNTLSYTQAKNLLDKGQKAKLESRAAPAPRHGDVRYSNINFVKDYYDGWALLGLGPSSTDPRTGENIAGVANVYVLNDWAATYVQEMVQLLSGDITPTQYVDGVNLSNWIKKMNDSQSKPDTHTTASTDVTPQEMKSIYESMQQPWMKRIQKLGSAKQFDAMEDSLGNKLNHSQLRRYLINQTAKSGLFDPNQSRASVAMVKGTALEKQMIDSDVLMASGFAPGTIKNLSSKVLDMASPARGGFIKLLDAQEDWRFDLSNRRNMFFLSMADDAMTGLAYRLKEKYKALKPEDRAAKVWEEARDIIMRAVLTHEMGHTFGLHHNWAGSEDVLNFDPTYWRLRTNDGKNTALCTYPADANGDPDYNKATTNDGKLCPFYIPNKGISNYPIMLGTDTKSTSENLLSLFEYSYSSLMDYAGRYTIDGNGLGRYDKAGIMYGHADKVEVYKEIGSIPEMLFNEWWESDGSVLLLYSTQAQSFHYTSWYSQLQKKIYEDSNRMLVPYTQVKPVTSEGRSIGAFYTDPKDTTKRYPRVPYLFCTYTKGDISDGCNTRDFGADQYERMKQHVDGWDTWYIMRSFSRYNYPWDADAYVGRQYKRTYRRLKDFNNSYALYQGLFKQWYDETKIKAFFTDPVNGYGAYTVAMKDAFNMALRTLAMPDIKGFQDLEEQADGQKIYSEAVFTSKFRTDLTNGRYFETSWNTTDYERSCGLQWWECIHHVGFYLDKMMIIEALSDAQTYFVARDTAEDIRQWRISFFNNFSTQIIDFFGSVLSHDYDKFAPWFDPNKPGTQTVKDSKGIQWVNGVAWRNYADTTLDPAKPTGGGAVESSTRFTLQLYMLVYGMLEFHQNFDKEYVARARLWKKGSKGTITIKTSTKITGITTFDDPFTGITYEAVAYKDNKGIAQRMLAYANRLKSRTDYCTAKGTVTPAPPDECQANIFSKMKAKAESELYQYSQLLDILVQLTAMYDNDGKNWSDDYQDP